MTQHSANVEMSVETHTIEGYIPVWSSGPDELVFKDNRCTFWVEIDGKCTSKRIRLISCKYEVLE